MTSPDDRRKPLDILDEGIANGGLARELALLLGVGLSTLQRWRRQFAGECDGVDRRKSSRRDVAHRLSEEERQRNLLICNEPDLQRCRLVKSCVFWPIAGFISVRNTAFTGC